MANAKYSAVARSGEHAAAGALGVQPVHTAFIRRIWVRGAVEKQQRRGPVAIRVAGRVVIALAQGGGEDAGAGEGKGSVEKQAEHHLTAIGIAASKGARGAELALHSFNEIRGEGDVINVLRAGGDR